MTDKQVFEEAGFVERYRSEYEKFYRPFFDSDEAMENFFYAVFKNDCNDKKPRWMMNSMQQCISLAKDIETIRPGRDPLRILFLRMCMESMCKISGLKNNSFCEKLSECFSEEGKDYILSNFKFSRISMPDGLPESKRLFFDDRSCYRLTIGDFLNVIRAVRNNVVHEGDYWSTQFFANDPECIWLTDLDSDVEIIPGIKKDPLLKDKVIKYNFETTMKWEMFVRYFTEACIHYVLYYVALADKAISLL